MLPLERFPLELLLLAAPGMARAEPARPTASGLTDREFRNRA